MKRLDLIPNISELGVDKLRLWRIYLMKWKKTDEISEENLKKQRLLLLHLFQL